MTDELEPREPQPDSDHHLRNADIPPQSRWLPVGLGVIGVILILAVLWPTLRGQFMLRPGPSDVPTTGPEPIPIASPGSDAQFYELARASYRAGRFEQAWAQFRSVPAYRLAVDTYPDIPAAERAVESEPESKEAHFKLGTAWARARLLEAAEIAFQKAIALDSQYVDARTNLGVVYYQMGRLSDALAEYDAALAVNPDDADVHYNKGAVYVQQAVQASPPSQDLLNQGLHEFRRALEIDPDLPQAYFSLGVVYMMQGQDQAAIDAFRRFQELDDGSDPQATQSAQNYLSKLEQ